MKHLIRDIIISCIDVLGISFLYRLYCRRRGPLVRVLCFHDVADAAWFESVIAMLTKKYHVITPEQFHEGNFDAEKINVLLTFDDGYQSWIDNCLPVLRHYGLKGLFFVNSGLLDAAEVPQKADAYMRSHLRILPKKALTWVGLKKLSSGGHTIGGHTVSHVDLADLDPSTIQREVGEDKKKLEVFLQKELTDFAYPFGKLPKDEAGSMRGSGYGFRHSADSGWYRGSGEHLVRRTLLEKTQSIASVRSWVEGGYDIFKQIV